VAAGAGLAAVVVVATISWLAASDSFRRVVERRASVWADAPVRIGAASAVFLPHPSLRLMNVRVGEPTHTTLGVVQVAVPFRALLAGRVEDAELTVFDSRLNWPLAVPPATSGPVSVRSVFLRDVTVTGGDRAVRLSADLSLEGARVVIDALTATAGGNTLDASGTIDLAPRIDAAIAVRADTLDMDDLLVLGARFTSASIEPPGSMGQVRVSTTVSSTRATLAGVEIGRLEATMTVENGRLTIDPLTFDMFGGRYLGSVELPLVEGSELYLRGRVANLDVARLSEFGGAPGAITGRLFGSGGFAARGADIATLLGSARGVGEVVVSDGSLARLDLVRRAMQFLGNAADDAGPDGEEDFDEITATFALVDRTLRSDDLLVRSPHVDAFARGTLGLTNRDLRATVDLVLSEALSARADGTALRYARAANRLALPVRIGGTFGQPTFGIDAGAVLSRGIRTVIERRLENLLDHPPTF
jgi:AsmA protein